MSMIKSRLSKLEEMSRDRNGALRVPGISTEEMLEIRRVAATCGNPDEVAAFLRTRLPDKTSGVVSIEDRRRDDAVLGAFARTIFEEVRE